MNVFLLALVFFTASGRWAGSDVGQARNQTDHSAIAPASADGLDELARDFWVWRATEQPLSGDDIPRIDRPADWVPEWSQAAVAQRRQALAAFEDRWRRLDTSGWPISPQVDYRLIGSALARVRWELDVTRGWQRNPMVYLYQTLGAVYDRLLPPPPLDRVRSEEIVKRMARIPQTVEDAKINLDQARAPFARLAMGELQDVRPRLLTVVRELKPWLTAESAGPLDAATERAIVALESFRDWLQQRVPTLPTDTAVGREAYVFFLKNVALMPFTPEQLLAMGQQEWERAVAFETYERQRNEGVPQLSLFPNQAAQMARQEQDEQAIRRFLQEKGILTVPDWVQHYRNLPVPTYVQPLASLGVTDDLTGPTRLKENGTSYIWPPAPTLGYFALSTARDPRPIIVHEGIPGHYFQLVLSWAHEDPIRRHYYDSGANEGIGFYAEEMMLQAGLFDDSPRTREIIYNFMRLRALRVEVDVKLALGLFTIDQAAEYLTKTVPMDAETARAEAAFFAFGPGQAITYQIGKLQIMKFLADARRLQGEAFDLRAFHDFVWKNGNVPIALQRWEYLGLGDEIEATSRNQ
jgi:uncharacterized protein (DUF885 family)